MHEPHEMSLKTKLLIGIPFGLLVVVAAVAPFAMMLLPNPIPVRVASIAAQPSGAYITSGGTSYHVFALAERTDAFPPDSPAVVATSVVSIKSDQLDQPSNYSLFTFDGKPIGISRSMTQPNILELHPNKPLSPGRYFAQIARDGMFGGTDYVYFSVTAAPGAAQ